MSTLAFLLALLAGCDGAEPEPTASSTNTTVSTTSTTVIGSTYTSITSTTTDTVETGDTSQTTKPKVPPVVILFIGDGMGYQHIRGGGLYKNGTEGSLIMESLDVEGSIYSASLSGLTDSAASATAISTGHKTYNSRVGMDRDDAVLPNIRELASDLGLATGIVTTDKVIGATPAAFLAHTEKRTNYEEIVSQVLSNLPDVMLGGGHTSLSEGLVKMGITPLATRDELLAYTPGSEPLIGIFSDTTLPYVVDSDEKTPTLAEMTLAALEHLDQNADGFFLMVEGARIDHASHANDGEKVFPEVASLDDAVEATVGWLDGREATVIVTADHETGGLSIDTKGAKKGVSVSTEWLWGYHTNFDIPVFGRGANTEILQGEVYHNNMIFAVLEATIRRKTPEIPPVPRLADGRLADLDNEIAVASHVSDFGEEFNQLDALWVTTDADGLWLGVSGVMERDNNAVIALLDIDFGSSTGITSPELSDYTGDLDLVISNLDWSTTMAGLGFEAAVGSVGGNYAMYQEPMSNAGLRTFYASFESYDNLYWSDGVVNFDDGNLAIGGEPAPDAGPVGLTEGGLEMFVPWEGLYLKGLPKKGAELALFVTLVNTTGDYMSNQTLPSFAPKDGVGDAVLEVTSVVSVTVDGDGELLSIPVVVK